MRHRTLKTCIVLAGAAFTQPALAQGLSGQPGKPGFLGEAKLKSKLPPPPAVPGAVARPSAVAPAERNAADLPPTEALFDAINRGDIVTARDAVSRGADIDGSNLLGMTPLELSVDLSRNDITFLLLSLRGTGSGSRAANGPVQQATAQTKAEARLARVRALPKTPGVAAADSAPPARQMPVLYAGNGGAAVPAAGFLGFDAKGSASAR